MGRPLAVWIVAASIFVAAIAAATAGGLDRREVVRFDRPGSAVNVALAGRGIVYSPLYATRPTVTAIVDGKATELFRAPLVPVPARFRRQGAFNSTIHQDISSLAGAPGIVAFVRTVSVVQTPKCRPQCSLASQSERLFSEVRARFGSGPFRVLAGGRGRCPTGQFWPEDVAVTANRVVYGGRLDGCKGRPVESRVGYVNTGSSNRRIVAARFPRTGPVLVAASHLFIAWSRDWSGVRRPDLHDDSLVVYNAGGARILYRARIPRKPRIDALYSLALQSDGTVAALLSREGVGCEHPQLVWARPGAAPAVHIYRSKPALGSSDVELVDSRLLFLREATKRCESSGKAELVLGSLVSLDTRVLGRYDPRAQPPLFPGPTFDFDGTRSVFSEGTLSEGGRSGSTTVFVDEQR